jgi:hypothetical protein
MGTPHQVRGKLWLEGEGVTDFSPNKTNNSLPMAPPCAAGEGYPSKIENNRRAFSKSNQHVNR